MIINRIMKANIVWTRQTLYPVICSSADFIVVLDFYGFDIR